MATPPRHTKLRLKVIKVPRAVTATNKDIEIPLNTEDVFIYRIEVKDNLAYIFYDERLFK